MQLFQYAIYFEPKKDDKKDPPEKARILVEPKVVLASDANKAGILASRDIPEEYLDRLEEVTVAVRPF